MNWDSYFKLADEYSIAVNWSGEDGTLFSDVDDHRNNVASLAEMFGPMNESWSTVLWNDTGTFNALDWDNVRIKWDHPQFTGGPDVIHDLVKEHISQHGPRISVRCIEADTVWSFDDGKQYLTTVDPTTEGGLYRLKESMLYGWQLIGLYQGASYSHCGMFRPAGDCKMRFGGLWYPGLDRVRVPPPDSNLTGHDVAFCFVCKYEIINILDRNLLPLLAKRMAPK